VETASETGGWKIGYSITLEIDSALSVLSGYFGPLREAAPFVALQRSLDSSWLNELAAMIGPRAHSVGILEYGAILSNVLFEERYDVAMLEIRRLSVAEVRSRLGISVDSRLDEAVADMERKRYEAHGLSVQIDTPTLRDSAREVDRLTRVLKGGDLHEKFWHWLDQFYYRWYEPWRKAQEPSLSEERKRVTALLGAESAIGRRPPTSWLAPQNALRILPALEQSVERGVKVFFWIEPIGLTDSWGMTEGWVYTACGDSTRGITAFRETAENLAARAHAIGDPTRLIILRLIRNFPLMNTEIADALSLSRPTVSVHAKILREAGLIVSRQDGHAVRHEIQPSEIRRLFDDLHQFLDLEPETSPGDGI
jgi:ArsR family transcriptional regulator